MSHDRQAADELSAQLRSMDDQALVARWRKGHFAAHAIEAARAELTQRGITPPEFAVETEQYLVPTISHDMVIVARRLNPTEAHILRSALAAGGVPAVVDDINAANSFGHLAYAPDGVRVRVSEQHQDRAREIMDDLAAGLCVLEDEPDENADNAPASITGQRLLAYTGDQAMVRRWGEATPRVPGFSVAALLFGPIWFIYRKLFSIGCVLFVLELAMIMGVASRSPSARVFVLAFVGLRLAMTCSGEAIYYANARKAVGREARTEDDEATRQAKLQRSGGVNFPAALGALMAYHFLTYSL